MSLEHREFAAKTVRRDAATALMVPVLSVSIFSNLGPAEPPGFLMAS